MRRLDLIDTQLEKTHQMLEHILAAQSLIMTELNLCSCIPVKDSIPIPMEPQVFDIFDNSIDTATQTSNVDDIGDIDDAAIPSRSSQA